MADYITTYTGEHFILISPEKDKLNIEDIAHALFEQYKNHTAFEVDCVIPTFKSF